jgi:long-chain acyl-CoA synthetase
MGQDVQSAGDREEEDARQQLAAQGMVLAHWARAVPDEPAVLAPSGARTFFELNERANQLARALRRRGVAPGDGIALLCSNRPEFAEVYYATQRSGLRLTPVNWHLTGGEAAYIVGDCEARAIVADASAAHVALEAVDANPSCTVRLAVGGAIAGFEDYDAAVSCEDGADLTDPELGGTMLYTSGTTGRPKGVFRTEPATRSVAAMTLGGYRHDGHDLHLCTGPLYHAAPLAFSLAAPLSVGVGTVLMERWEPEETLRLIERHSITHTHMVPTMFHRLLSLPDDVRDGYDISSLRFALHGAAPCPVAVKQRLMEWWGPIVWEYYAATEGTGSLVDPVTWLEHPGTVGKPIVHGQVLIGDDVANELPVGEVGLVYLRAPDKGRFQYFKDASKTADTYRGDYFTLGDVGYVDAEGFLYLTDRSANLIISGGVNIYPAEVDAVLLEHPYVADAATIGVPDPDWGERVLAVVELRSGRTAAPDTAAELIEFCRARLAHYKCPSGIEFVDTLPRQDNGKIYKRLLRDRHRADANGVDAGARG